MNKPTYYIEKVRTRVPANAKKIQPFLSCYGGVPGRDGFVVNMTAPMGTRHEDLQAEVRKEIEKRISVGQG